MPYPYPVYQYPIYPYNFQYHYNENIHPYSNNPPNNYLNYQNNHLRPTDVYSDVENIHKVEGAERKSKNNKKNDKKEEKLKDFKQERDQNREIEKF